MNADIVPPIWNQATFVSRKTSSTVTLLLGGVSIVTAKLDVIKQMKWSLPHVKNNRNVPYWPSMASTISPHNYPRHGDARRPHNEKVERRWLHLVFKLYAIISIPRISVTYSSSTSWMMMEISCPVRNTLPGTPLVMRNVGGGIKATICCVSYLKFDWCILHLNS